MKSRPLVCLFTVFVGIAACFPQKPGKKPTAPPAKDTAILPFDLARKVTMAVMQRTQYGVVPLGSAVWIGKKGYLATCEHVVRNVAFPLKVGMAYDPYLATGAISVTISRAMNITDATIAASDAATDVAILKASQTPDQFFGQLVTGSAPPNSASSNTTTSAAGAVLSSDLPARGATLLLSGYPLDGRMLILQVATATGEAFSDQPSTESLRMMLSVVSNPGNSGGPVLDSSGAVVGLLEGNRHTQSATPPPAQQEAAPPSPATVPNVAPVPGPLPRVIPVPPMPVVAPVPFAPFVTQESAQTQVRASGFNDIVDDEDDWRNGQTFVIASGKKHIYVGRHNFSFNSSGDDDIHRVRSKLSGDFIWFERDGKYYVIRDEATIKRALDLFAPMQALDEKQEELGKQQEALGEQQEALGQKMEEVKVTVPDMTAELDRVREKLKQLGAGGTQEELGELQSEIGELQSRIGELQSQAGRRQSEIGRQQGELGRKQGELGRKQGEIGRQQGELSKQATREMKSIIDDAIAHGLAKPE